VSGDNVRFEWPPPGVDIVRLGFPETWVIVYGQPTEGDSETWWVTDLSTIAGFWGMQLEELMQLTARAVVPNPVLAFAGTLGRVPVIYSPSEGLQMRWIRVTYRGTLAGGIEEFQWKMDWGNPGNDPVLAEAEAPALAEDIATALAADWIAVSGTHYSMQALCSADVRITEVGVTSWVQDQPKNADGTGGDARQEYPNAFHAYPIGGELRGNGAMSLPYETSCAVTLLSDKRGPSGRNRLYLPPFATLYMKAGGVYDDITPISAGEFIGRHIDSVKALRTYVPVAVSMRQKVLNEIKAVEVGKVPDSQRRRRRSQDEARVVAWSSV
jgi:hypothetical protein